MKCSDLTTIIAIHECARKDSFSPFAAEHQPGEKATDEDEETVRSFDEYMQKFCQMTELLYYCPSAVNHLRFQHKHLISQGT